MAYVSMQRAYDRRLPHEVFAPEGLNKPKYRLVCGSMGSDYAAEPGGLATGSIEAAGRIEWITGTHRCDAPARASPQAR